MAQRVVTTYIDDIDGTEIPNGESGSVSFALDGKHYLIDLTATNAEQLRQALQPYIAVAKTGSSRARKSSPGSASPTGPSAQELREWARQNGFTLPDRGRIPNDVRQAWQSKH